MRELVFDCDLNPKFFSLNAGIHAARRYSESTFSAPAEWWPQRGALERRREPRGGGAETEQGHWAGRGSAHVDHPIQPGLGQSAGPANQRGPRRAQPLTAGSLVPLFSALLAARHTGRGATAPSAAAARPQAWSRSRSHSFFRGNFGLVFGET